ncbi:MAG: energy transducer TonB [Gammaproteobacteria bacterium]|nr:energy transducer TonB [Gammaproteobacteria bacterium]
MNQTPPKIQITSSDRLGFTLFIALMFHAIIVLGISFTHQPQNKEQSLPNLEVILAQSKTLETPEDFDFLSQENQQGGGKEKEKNRPSSATSANTPIDQQGFANKAQNAQQQSATQQLEQKFISSKESDNKHQSAEKQNLNSNKTPHQQTQTHLRIAQLRAEIRKMNDDRSKWPKTLYLTASTKKAIEASYLAEWVRHIERVGNINYPVEAQQKNISGALRLQVTINSKGEVLNIKISKPSGSSILDAAAKRIVKLAQPFKPFSKELKKGADKIVIIRTWDFSNQTQQFATSS